MDFVYSIAFDAFIRQLGDPQSVCVILRYFGTFGLQAIRANTEEDFSNQMWPLVTTYHFF